MKASIKYMTLFLSLAIPTSYVYADVADEASSEYCKCTTPVIKAVNDSLEALKDGDFERMKALQEKMQAQDGEIDKCLAALSKKYEKVEKDEAFKKAVQDKIKEKCPTPKFDLETITPGIDTN